ncbi:hypothetical protein BD779DRAFT_1575270 [Infundibulicybe gibba]|nr:hypothetical protein BD779DRAFT_1575270 [Infundibulicybe gibba]
MLGPLPGVFEPVWESDRHKLPLISWEVIAAHSCQAAAVGVSDLGGTVAAALMDALDLRFACLECPPSSAGSCLKVGYPWKSAVEHEATRVKQNEKDGSEHLPSWSCSHCARNLNDWHSKDRDEPADLFWYPGKYRISSLILASTEIVEPKS